jgi:tetratricopeptide (TPR) repeat protein
VKRALVGTALVAGLLAGTYGYVVSQWEADYRELLVVGDAAAARGDFVAAIEAFSSARWLKPDSMAAYLKRGEAYWRRGELESAARDLRVAVELDPSAPRPRELLGDISYAMGRYERAAERYREYVELDDSSQRLFYKLGLARYRAGQPSACVTALGDALKLDDQSGEAYYLLGLCLRDVQKPRDAIAALERAVSLAPAMLQSREELADAYGRLGRTESRIEQLDALRALDPGPSREVSLGLAYAAQGDSASAVRVLSGAARRYPGFRYTYVALGRVWLDVAHARKDRVALNKAIEALHNATELDENGEALTLSGRALMLAGDLDAAERALQQATRQLPVEPAAFAYLADVAERLGHLDVAREALIDYDSLQDETADGIDAGRIALRIADLSIRLEEPRTALVWYERAAIDAADPALLARIAEAQLASGDAGAAKASVEKAFAMSPANPAVLAARRKVGQKKETSQ